MSRRRGEFEHRTSIFEGAFRAWSHLGGLDPADLETKPASDLDPLNFPLENDPRLAALKEKEKDKKPSGSEEEGGAEEKKSSAEEFSSTFNGDDENGGKRKEYPYEPLPRSGLAHPFVQAILSPWLGPDADQDAIQLGLTTLRTWWQHRRKGESGSAIVALGTEKMRGVVEGYTRHFFNLAHCLIVNDKEQPPRTLQSKMRDLEKSRNKKGKKRSREDDSVKIATMAFKSGFGGGMPPIQNNDDMGGMGQLNSMGGMGNMGGMGGSGLQGNDMMPQGDMMSSLERLHAAQRRQLAESGGVHSNMTGQGMPGMPQDQNAAASQLEMKGRCIPGRVNLPGLVQQVSSAATQLAHRGMINVDPADILGASFNNSSASNIDPSKYGDPNVMPVVLVSQNGDVQFFMRIDGITCAHCVKIVETVLRGCQGNRSPITGLVDAAADQDLNLVLIKIEKISEARRIAFEAARNLSMVGYTAKARSVNVREVSKGNDVDLQGLCSAFEVVPNINPMSVFNWNMDCACPDNGVHRQDCARHSQMSRSLIDVFDKTERLVSEIITGCGKKFGMPCNAGMNCFCRISNNSNEQQKMQEQLQQQQQQQQFMNNQMNQYSAGMSYQQPIQDNSQGGNNDFNGQQMGGNGRMPRQSMRMSFGGLGRHLNMGNETTFGRAMSGLSALSIDWENMEDFDINVDHSAHINNDIINSQQQGNQNQNQQQQLLQQQQLMHQQQQQLQQQQQQQQLIHHNLKDDRNGNGLMDNGDMNGYNMQNGMHNMMQNMGYNMGLMERRSSLRKNIPMDPNGNMNNVSFNI